MNKSLTDKLITCGIVGTSLVVTGVCIFVAWWHGVDLW